MCLPFRFHQLTRNQGLPEFICERCFSELDLATKFRERCIFSQKYLLDIRNKSQDPSIVYIDEGPEPLDEQLIDADQCTKLVSPLASCEVFSWMGGSSVGQKKRARVFRDQSTGRWPVCF